MPSFLSKHAPAPRRRESKTLSLSVLQHDLQGKPLVFLPESRGAGPSGSSIAGATPTIRSWMWTVLAIAEMQGLSARVPFHYSAWGPNNDGPRGRQVT